MILHPRQKRLPFSSRSLKVMLFFWFVIGVNLERAIKCIGDYIEVAIPIYIQVGVWATMVVIIQYKFLCWGVKYSSLLVVKEIINRKLLSDGYTVLGSVSDGERFSVLRIPGFVRKSLNQDVFLLENNGGRLSDPGSQWITRYQVWM